MEALNKIAAVAVAAAAATTLAVTGFAGPALAATVTSCSAAWSVGRMTCTTPDWVPSNAAHQIRVTVYSTQGCKTPWVVYDITTGKNAASGKGPTGDNGRVLSGVYGLYTASLTNACWHDTIYLKNY